MKYTLKQRLDIGRRIYEGELTRFQAAEEYGINDNTARNYIKIPTIFHLKMPEVKEKRMLPKLHNQSKQNNLILNHMNP